MYYLGDFCCICFYNKEHLQHLSDSSDDNLTYFIKLTSCVPEMHFNGMNDQRLVCKICCETIDAAYKFRQKCLRSKTMLISYISQLHQFSKINGAVNVHLTDISELNSVITEVQDENDMKTLIEKNELFGNTDKDNRVTEILGSVGKTNIKCEPNPINFKVCETENNFVEFENVLIKMESDNQNYEECVEDSIDNPLGNQVNIITEVSQSDTKLTVRGIKKEIESQDVVEDFQESLDDTSEVSDGENSIQKRFLKHCDSPLYLENDSNDTNPNKIDIVHNDIELMDGEISTECKREDVEEITKENDVASSKKPENIIHMSTHTDKPHECTLCNKTFTKSSSLKDHMRIHTGEKPYKCDYCKKSFSQTSHLTTHMKIHPEVKPYECDICSRTYVLANQLQNHMRIHIGDKPHECSTCNKKFSKPSSLKDHMRIHTGEKPYQCDVCKKPFNQTSHLTTHMRIHSGEKPFACDICRRTFCQSSQLNNHMRIHTGNKPHECGVCKKNFIQLGNLSRHMVMHTGEKPYECEMCKKKFSWFSNLTKHMRIHSKPT